MPEKVYYLGDGAEALARTMWADSDVAELTADSTDADHVLVHKFLQYLPLKRAIDNIRRIAALTKDGGTLTVTVPCLDWAARLMCQSEVPESVWYALYGDGDSGVPHLSGYTVQRLRQMLGAADFIVVEASTIEEQLVTQGEDGKDKPLPYRLCVVTGVKRHVADKG